MEIFLNLVEKVGFPAAALVAVGLGVWRIIVWTGNKVVLPVTTSHIALVEEAKEANKANTATLVSMAESAKVTGSAIVRIADQHEESLKLTREIHQHFVKNRDIQIRAENAAIRIENTAIRNENEQNQGDQK